MDESQQEVGVEKDHMPKAFALLLVNNMKYQKKSFIEKATFKELKLGVLDMLMIPDTSTLVIAKVYDINVTEKLYKLCYNEGYNGLNVVYPGRVLVSIEFKTQSTCINFKQCKEMKKLFKEILPI